ncbi:MAG: helix-turn-helix transcriptional regulator [Rhizobacter sp.]|nr:helix-turn-helix transcriptional regulator [Rhizobacter sp.]
MTFLTHNHRYEGTSQLHGSLELPNMRIEHRSLNPGVLRPDTCTCQAISVTLAGRTAVRWTGAGAVQRAIAVQPGIASILPAGFHETEVEIVSPVECLQIFLAPCVTATSALADHDVDPARSKVDRAAGVSDPLLQEVGAALLRMISRPPEPTDRLFIEGASSMLAAHLVSRYSTIAPRAAPYSPSLSYEKLKRVLDLVDCRFAEGIGLDELAAEACLSPFHFSRLFQKATGFSPHRYVTERRVREAKSKLAEGRLSLVEIALEAGFGSQGNFNRIFRKHTGLTPGQFRSQQRS